jgi:hypothetical protein
MVVLARVLLVVTALATGSAADLRSSTAAMACCAKTHHRCAGLSSPDDCCKRMGHATTASLAGTLSAVQPLVVPVSGVIDWLPANVMPAQTSTHPDFSFTRPHDPPHLHPFSLLI